MKLIIQTDKNFDLKTKEMKLAIKRGWVHLRTGKDKDGYYAEFSDFKKVKKQINNSHQSEAGHLNSGGINNKKEVKGE